MKHSIKTDFEYESARLQALIDVMRDTSWCIPARRLRFWRACVRTTGHLIGLEDLGELTLFATDGVLGLFRRNSSGIVDTYHTHRPSNHVQTPQEKIFTGAIAPLVQKPKLEFHDTDADGNPIVRQGRTSVSVHARRKKPLDAIAQLLIAASLPRTIRDDIRDSL
jgi:hypothetical protein